MKRGLAAFTRKDYPRAALEFKIAAQNMPKDAEPVYQLGMTYLKAGAGQQAFDAFHKAEGINPEHEGARYQANLMEANSNNADLLDEARSGLRTYLLKHPSSAQARGTLALVEARLGNQGEAIRQLQEAVANKPEDMTPASAVLSYYAAKGNLAAIPLVTHALTERLPNSAEAATVRAEAAIATGSLADADEEIGRALKLKPAFRPALQLRLQRDVATNNRDEAFATARALSKLPDRVVWTAYGNLLFAAHRQEEGMKEYEQLLKEHPDDAGLRDEYSSVLMRSGRHSEALAVVNETLEKNPKDRAALLQRVALKTDSGDLDGASQDVKTLHDLKAFSAELSYREAHIFGARGDTAREGDLLADALKLNSHLLIARLELAQLLISGGNPRKALEVLEQAAEVERSALDYFRVHAMALIAAEEYVAARKDVDIGLANGRQVPFLFEDAILKEHAKDLSGARKSLEEGFAKAPGYPPVMAMLQRIMDRQGETQRFVAMVKDAAAKYPGNPDLQLGYGQLLAAQGNAAGARAALEAAKAAGAVADAEFEIAQLDARTSPDRARQELAELAKTHDSARVEIALADLDASKGAAPDAIVHYYLRAVQLEPSNVLALNNLAGILTTQKDKLEDALFWAQKALALSGESPVVEDTVGWIYYLEKKYDAALPLLVKSLKGQDRPAAHYHLAAALLANRDAAGARREYEAGVKQDPKSPARAEVSALFEK